MVVIRGGSIGGSIGGRLCSRVRLASEEPHVCRQRSSQTVAIAVGEMELLREANDYSRGSGVDAGSGLRGQERDLYFQGVLYLVLKSGVIISQAAGSVGQSMSKQLNVDLTSHPALFVTQHYIMQVVQYKRHPFEI